MYDDDAGCYMSSPVVIPQITNLIFEMQNQDQKRFILAPYF
jgi:hypothetical protein